ncbi:MAG: DUF2397 family protein [Streptosporangiaceae bacterium]|nr:DUF2397 family protein [Streptosporangiaceae bacterium]
MTERAADGADRGGRNSLDLDALAVSDRFRLFNFTRRDDHVAYLWVLRALDRLRAVHQVQAHSDDVAAALSELAAAHGEVPRLDGGIREKLDALAEDGVVHRLEDASRAGSLARYRNRQLHADRDHPPGAAVQATGRARSDTGHDVLQERQAVRPAAAGVPVPGARLVPALPRRDQPRRPGADVHPGRERHRRPRLRPDDQRA